jgi:hypothetical protein
MILVAGGDADPNIACLANRLAERGTPRTMLRVGRGTAPRLTWDLVEDRLRIDGEPIDPCAVFLRYDVFTQLQDGGPGSQRRAGRWYHALLSWALAHENVTYFNRSYGARHTAKPYTLLLAKAAGLAIPQTLISNDPEALDELDPEGWIAKPVTGGEHTEVVADVCHDKTWRHLFADAPTIIQRRLAAPDLRIYRIGDRWFPFTLCSEKIDYRASRKPTIQPAAAALDLIRALAALMNQLGLDFGAADFKQCADTGQYLFLEVNSAPMFSAFDRVISGALTDAIADWLTATPTPSASRIL